jgi:hypothetical protein
VCFYEKAVKTKHKQSLCLYVTNYVKQDVEEKLWKMIELKGEWVFNLNFQNYRNLANSIHIGLMCQKSSGLPVAGTILTLMSRMNTSSFYFSNKKSWNFSLNYWFWHNGQIYQHRSIYPISIDFSLADSFHSTKKFKEERKSFTNTSTTNYN